MEKGLSVVMVAAVVAQWSQRNGRSAMVAAQWSWLYDRSSPDVFNFYHTKKCVTTHFLFLICYDWLLLLGTIEVDEEFIHRFEKMGLVVNGTHCLTQVVFTTREDTHFGEETCEDFI